MQRLTLTRAQVIRRGLEEAGAAGGPGEGRGPAGRSCAHLAAAAGEAAVLTLLAPHLAAPDACAPRWRTCI